MVASGMEYGVLLVWRFHNRLRGGCVAGSSEMIDGLLVGRSGRCGQLGRAIVGWRDLGLNAEVPKRPSWVYWVSRFACGGPAEPTVREPPVVKQN